ncbi:MAG: DNA-3-methyladenine glycosylase 2 family protein [Pseudomonadota bacterium]
MSAPSPRLLKQACDALAERDACLAHAYQTVGLPTWRATAPTYQALARIVVYQLISTKAADVIWGRIQDRLESVTAEAVLRDNQEALRACGLSRPKLGHLNAIAEAVRSGALDLNAMREQPITDARRALLAIKGIGPWTADTFLMTALGHLDAFPSGDVGLIEAYRQLDGADARLTAKAFTAAADSWRPYRAVAAHLLYDWYNSTRR